MPIAMGKKQSVLYLQFARTCSLCTRRTDFFYGIRTLLKVDLIQLLQVSNCAGHDGKFDEVVITVSVLYFEYVVKEVSAYPKIDSQPNPFV